MNGDRVEFTLRKESGKLQTAYGVDFGVDGLCTNEDGGEFNITHVKSGLAMWVFCTEGQRAIAIELIRNLPTCNDSFQWTWPRSKLSRSRCAKNVVAGIYKKAIESEVSA